MRFTWHLRASPVSRKRRYSVVKTTKSDCIMLSREIVKLTRSNDRPGFHRARNFFTRDSCNRAAARLRSRNVVITSGRWSQSTRITSRPPVAAPVFLRPFSRIDKRTGKTEAKRDGGKGRNCRYANPWVHYWRMRIDDRGGDVLTGRFG